MVIWRENRIRRKCGEEKWKGERKRRGVDLAHKARRRHTKTHPFNKYGTTERKYERVTETSVIRACLHCQLTVLHSSFFFLLSFLSSFFNNSQRPLLPPTFSYLKQPRTCICPFSSFPVSFSPPSHVINHRPLIYIYIYI